MNGSSFPATMEREGGSGCGNKVTLASCRHCMAEQSRTEILYAQGWVCVCVCLQRAGSGRKQERLEAIFLPLPACSKAAEWLRGAAVLEITLPPFPGWVP